MSGKWLAILTLTAALGGATGAGAASLVARREAAATPAAAAAGRPTLAAAAGGTATAPRARAATTSGTVDRVEGETLTMRTPGGPVAVPLTAPTTLVRQTAVAPTDLKVGESVIGRGEEVGGQLVVRQLQVVPPGGGAVLADPADDAVGRAGPGGPGDRGRAGGAGGPAGAGGQGEAGRGPGGAGPRPGGPGVVGTLAKLDGQTITVLRSNGDETTATLAPDATIQRLAPATREELKAGQSVSVVSARGADGQPRTIVTITSA